MAPAYRKQPTLPVNPGSAAQEKTVVVLGAYRGGTSLVASVLRELGVFMGASFADLPEYDNVEDLEFQRLLHVGHVVDPKVRYGVPFTPADFPVPDALRALIERRDREHSLWGWKYPGTVLWMLHSPLASYLRNPHFITILRDPLAICQHELDVGRIRPEDLRSTNEISYLWVSRQMQWLSEFIVRCNYPHLLISYEKVRWGGETERSELIDRLSDFLSPSLREPRREAARNAIFQAGPPRRVRRER